MKTFSKLLFISLLIVFVTNCKKKDTGPDLTTNLVGIYTGTIQFTSPSFDTTAQNQQLQITKVSDTEIQIQPYNNGGGSTFTANLSQSGSNTILTIPVENISGGGNIQGVAGDTSKYTTSSKQLYYSIQESSGGATGVEKFTGIKQ